MSEPALRIHNLNMHFGALQVAHGINFQLERGARHALIGPNGAGKTTLVNLITGVLSPSGGQVILQGRDVTRLNQAQRSRLGLARTFQINQLFRNLSTLENVCMAVAERRGVGAALLRPLGKHGEVIDEAVALLAQFRLLEARRKPVAQLAYGQQRLVELAIALGQRPQVLILDEPAAGVPSSESRMILEAIEKLPDDMAVLIIEHDMELVFRFARRISVLVGGEILAEGAPDDIAGHPQVRAVYLGAEHGAA